MKNETLKLEKIDGVFFSVAFIGFSLHPLTSLALLTCLPALNICGCSKRPVTCGSESHECVLKYPCPSVRGDFVSRFEVWRKGKHWKMQQ